MVDKKRKQGRPSKEPNGEQRHQIETLAGYGLTEEEIASVMRLSIPSIKKYCKEEIVRGRNTAKTLVTQSLFANIKKGKEASIFFWLKCRARWSERAGDMAAESSALPNITVNIRTPKRLDDTDEND